MKLITIHNTAGFYASHIMTAKKDVRFYLEGIHLNIKNGMIEATNGHLAFQCDGGFIKNDDSITSNETLGDSCIIKLDKYPTVLKQEGWLDICSDGIAIYTNAKTSKKHTIPYTILSAKYPDVSAVIPSLREDNQGEKGINIFSVNPEYIARIHKAFNKLDSITIRFYDYGTKMLITPRSNTWSMVLMTIRLPK